MNVDQFLIDKGYDLESVGLGELKQLFEAYASSRLAEATRILSWFNASNGEPSPRTAEQLADRAVWFAREYHHAKMKAAEAENDNLQARLAEVTAQLETLREKFKHYHVAKYVDEKLTDECGSCGFDLRNEIHIKREVHQKKILRVEHTFTNSAEWVILHLECGHTRSLRAAEYSHPNKTGTACCWDCQ
jgi:hypothetical protein